ncbi:MAG: DUF2061 domain-containing protein [Bacteroidia bacterium]|nr:DUF2061 domain-containing protein [Bacteroidia bacterium]MBT8309678.1 DUF2061 domain-containing protein [Bacteroidia bacterium]NNK27464.1 DUF2061 domain-containing protein [Flavobacteriaceae bacterium]NNL60415.1 DUF2061 domain-containing protein [Flavobacteriaceae bacterium]
MAKYRQESHLRSILKGISWRFVATTDTVLVVLLITCLTGSCSLENAIKIGAAEFLLKLIVYYIHERIWQRALKDGVVTQKETLAKTVTWRIIATTMTFVISGTVLEAFDEVALYIALIETVTKFILYYFHERIWIRIPLGRIRNFFINKEAK